MRGEILALRGEYERSIDEHEAGIQNGIKPAKNPDLLTVKYLDTKTVDETYQVVILKIQERKEEATKQERAS